MAATVLIREKNGAGETATDKTSGTIRFKNADNATVDAVNPLVKPASGNDRSFEKWLRLHIGGTGPTGQITNPQFYTDGTNNWGTGITGFIRTTNPGTYSTPAEPASDASGTDMFSFSSASRKDMDVANPGPFTGTNVDIADYAVLWMTLATTVSAPQNPTSSETITFSYDET